MKNVRFMTLTALLTAIAIFIPIAMPLKLVIPPASYTLGSHVAIFLAMFINPWMAIFVVLGSSYGFFISGAYPLVIVFRALSHIFNFVLELIHAVGEVLACVLFYSVSGTDLQSMFYVLFVLVGFGTVIHSMVDYELALVVYKVLQKRR